MIKTTQVNELGPLFLTLRVVGWTDIFIRKEYRDEIVQNLAYCIQHKGLHLHAYCLMTNHLHLIASSESIPLNTIVRDFKSFTGKKIPQMLNENPRESRKDWINDRLQYLSHSAKKDREFQFWDGNNYPEPIFSDPFYLQKERYIHQNPVVAGFVARPEDWLHSSACPESPLAISGRGLLVSGSV